MPWAREGSSSRGAGNGEAAGPAGVERNRLNFAIVAPVDNVSPTSRGDTGSRREEARPDHGEQAHDPVAGGHRRGAAARRRSGSGGAGAGAPPGGTDGGGPRQRRPPSPGGR